MFEVEESRMLWFSNRLSYYYYTDVSHQTIEYEVNKLHVFYRGFPDYLVTCILCKQKANSIEKLSPNLFGIVLDFLGNFSPNKFTYIGIVLDFRGNFSVSLRKTIWELC